MEQIVGFLQLTFYPVNVVYNRPYKGVRKFKVSRPPQVIHSRFVGMPIIVVLTDKPVVRKFNTPHIEPDTTLPTLQTDMVIP